MFVNVTRKEDAIIMLRYFDALKIEFYKFLFDEVLIDDYHFSDIYIQNYLYDVLANSPSFKIWNKESDYHTYDSHNILIEFSFLYKKVDYLKIVTEENTFIRKLIHENR